MKNIVKKFLSGLLRPLAGIAVVFNRIFNKGNPADNPAGKGTGNEARPRRRLVDGVDADRFTRLCVFVVIGFVSLIGAVLIAASVNSGGRRIEVDEEADAQNQPSGRLTLAFGGNIMPSQAMLDSALTDSGYHFDNDLSELSGVMSGDITVAGLCGQINVEGKNKHVGGFDENKNYPDELASAIAGLGVNYLFTANQHTFANGYDGMYATVSNLHVKSVGVIGVTNTDAGRLNTHVVRANGVTVGFAGYSCINSTGYKELSDEQKTYMAQLPPDADTVAERAAADMARLRSNGAEFIVVCINWGGVSTVEVNDFMKQAAEKVAKAGADVIVGYGPWVTLDADVIAYESGGVSKECYVFYSLGSLLADHHYEGNQNLLGLKGNLTDAQKKAAADEKKRVAGLNAAMSRSMTVSLHLTRGKDGTVSVEKAQYYPIYLIRNPDQGEGTSHLKYMAVPAAKYVSAEERPAIFADDAQWNNCKAAFKAIGAIADKTGGRLVLGDGEAGSEEPENTDAKI